MYRVTHNNKRGYRSTLDEAQQTVRDRLGAGKHLLLTSYCDVNASDNERIVCVYYTPHTGLYDLFVIEGSETEGENDERGKSTLDNPKP